MDLKKRRKELGLTQVAAAKKIEVSLSTYIWWEKGVMHPNPENYKKLQKVFQLDIEGEV